MTHLKLKHSKNLIHKRSRVVPLFFLFLSGILILIPLFYTPISSDDFLYILNNSEWSDPIWRYMHWSGRIVADLASLFLLQLPSIIYILIKGIIWILLIVLIAFMPSILNKTYKGEAKNFIIIFILYWIANPNLGQTSFWTVGFTNYLITNFFIVAYFTLIFYLKDERFKLWHFVAVPLLGLLAGNSNENTAIVVVLLTLVCILIEKRKQIFLIALPFTILGTLSLLLSPGQHARLQHPIFQIYREQSLFERLWNYFSTPWFIDTFKSFSWLFVSFIFIGFIYFFKKQTPQKTNLIYSIVFFFSAIIANAAFGGSYSFPVSIRALNGSLVLFLISISFILKDLVYTKTTLYKQSIVYFILLLCIPFSISYYFVTKSMISLQKQFNIREQIILREKKDGNQNIFIPNYYVGKLYNPSDSIDLFQGDIAAYYGVKSITTFNKDFNFDYSNPKLINSKQIPLNRDFGKDTHLTALNIFRDTRNTNKYSVNLTFDKNLLSAYSQDDSTLFIHVNWKRESLQNTTKFIADTALNNQLLVEGKYIFSSSIGDIRPKDISSIDVGIYNKTNNSNIINTHIILNK